MPNLNKIWDAVSANAGSAYKMSRGSGLGSMRAGLKGLNKADRRTMSATTRVMAGATLGTLVGGSWGAISDRESIVGGAVKGAFVGGAARGGMRALGRNPQFSRGMARLAQTRDMRSNVNRALTFMNQRRGLRNTVYGFGAYGAVTGAFSGTDNPLGGAVGGALSGGIQGAGMYGGYKAVKGMNLKWQGRAAA